MTKEQAIEVLEKIDVKFFISGMTEQKDYIIDKADEVNVAIETVLYMLKEKDKQIDLMAEMLVKITENNFIAKYLNQDLEEKKKEIKRYFENKAKELLNK